MQTHYTKYKLSKATTALHASTALLPSSEKEVRSAEEKTRSCFEFRLFRVYNHQ
jgi:hypothetical protein